MTSSQRERRSRSRIMIDLAIKCANCRFGNKLLREAEVVAECLAYHTQQYTTATVDIINISGN